MSPTDFLLLAAGGLVAGTINTLAGGASSITVPLLVLVGLPGGLANGTNRVGILVQSIWASLRFRAEGVSGFRAAGPVLLPIALGSLLGALTISHVADATFERLFGLVMVALLLPLLGGSWLGPRPGRRQMSRSTRFVVFFAIGVFGGAFQAGVGLFIVLALVYAGYDLVHANSIKVVVNTVLTAVAVPVFVAQGQVDWPAAAALSVGFIAGSTLGVRLAVRGGERVIRPVLALAVLLLAGKMLGLY